jgi:hypothetical protein
MNRLFATVATATIIGAGAAFAQTAPATTTEVPASAAQDMHGEIAAMEASVNAEFARHGINAEAGDLTLRQLNEVMLILNDDSLSEDDRIDQVRSIVEG